MVQIKDPQSKRVPPADAAAKGDANKKRKGKYEVAIKRDGVLCSCNRCKRKRLTRVFLPQELVFNILLRLPAQVIYDVMSHVCREWKDMIHTRNFINDHLTHSTSGLLIHRNFGINTFFVAMGQGGIEISKFDYSFRIQIRNSCNGLVLVPDFSSRQDFLYVANPITKQQITLPPFFKRSVYVSHCGLAYVTASMEYKVVRTYDHKNTVENMLCAILTIGVDQIWRHVDTKHLSHRTRRAFLVSPLVTGGFMHWIGETFVLTLNVETETVSYFPHGWKRGRFLAMGSNLSVVSPCNEFLWEVWEMKPETGEWTKLFDADFEAQRCMLEGLFCTHELSLWPVGWLKFREVLVFRVFLPSKRCIAYYVKTQEIHSFEFDTNIDSHRYDVHVNSLVWLNGC